MIRQALYRLTARLPARLICVDDAPYLERYYVGSLFGATVYLHRFVSPDQDRHVHDHPWPWAVSIVLVGHYIEESVRWLTPDAGWVARYVRRCWWRPNLLNARSLHRIHTASPDTWTLFVHGPRRKRWGFLEPAEQGATYRQPLDDKASIGWETTAPPGRSVGRVPYPQPPSACLAGSAGQIVAASGCYEEDLP